MNGLILYGPPAAGKDTVTAELTHISDRYRLFPRLKVGSGRTSGYRMTDQSHIAALRNAEKILWENERYGATYVVDRDYLDGMLADGEVPVVHLGQVEAVDAVTSAMIDTDWLTAWIWCPRDIAAERMRARATGDTAARLRAWDETEPYERADLTVDTSALSPAAAAATINGRITEGEYREGLPGH